MNRRTLSTVGYALGVMACLQLAGCSAKIYRLPEIGKSLTMSESSKVINGLIQSCGNTLAYRALWTTEISWESEQAVMRYAVLAKPPQQYRVEALPPAGAYSLALLTENNGKTRLLDIGQREAFLSNSSTGLVKRLTRVPLPLGDLVCFLLGQVPYNKAQQLRQAQVYEAKEGEVIVNGSSRGLVLRLDPLLGVVTEVHVLSALNDELEARFRYSQYQVRQELQIPRVVNIDLPRSDVRARLELDSFKLDGSIRDELFSIEIPPGFISVQ